MVAYSISLWRIPIVDRVPIIAIVLPSYLGCYESFLRFFSPLCAYFAPFLIKCTVSSVPVARLCSIAHVWAHFLRFSLISAQSLFERSFCTFYNISSSFFVMTVTFCDFDWNISPVYVHIFPLWILAYQVSIPLCVSILKRGICGPALAFSVIFSLCFSLFSISYDVVPR